MKKVTRRSGCAISSALDIFGDKWSLLIIRDIVFFGKNTYNEFLKSDEKISTNILADRLSMLENEGILKKEEHPASKSKIFYKISEKGIELLPLLIETILWSEKFLPLSEASALLAAKLRSNRKGILKELQYKLRQPLS